MGAGGGIGIRWTLMGFSGSLENSWKWGEGFRGMRKLLETSTESSCGIFRCTSMDASTNFHGRKFSYFRGSKFASMTTVTSFHGSKPLPGGLPKLTRKSIHHTISHF